MLAEFLGVPNADAPVRDLLLTHVSQVVYAAGHEACQVGMPFINQAVGGDVASYGYLRSAQSLASVGGCIAFGRFADVYGTRATMFAAHWSALAYSVLLAVAMSPATLLLTAVPCVAMHGFQAAQMVAARRSSPAARSGAFGQITFAYGLGIATGSALLAVGGEAVPPRAAAAVAAGIEAAFIVAMFRCDEAFRDDGTADGCTDVGAEADTSAWLLAPACTSTASVGAPFTVRLARLLGTPRVPQMLAAKFGIVSAAGMVLNMVPQFVLDPFGLGTTETALLLGYLSAVQMATQAFAGPWLDTLEGRTGMFKQSTIQVTVLGGSIVAMSLLAMVVPETLVTVAKWVAPTMASGLSLTATWRTFTFCLGPLAAAQQVVLIAVSTDLTKSVPQADTGLVLGIDMALFSATGVATPIAAAKLARRFGFAAVPLAGAALAASTVGSLVLREWLRGEETPDDCDCSASIGGDRSSLISSAVPSPSGDHSGGGAVMAVAPMPASASRVLAWHTSSSDLEESGPLRLPAAAAQPARIISLDGAANSGDDEVRWSPRRR